VLHCAELESTKPPNVNRSSSTAHYDDVINTVRIKAVKQGLRRTVIPVKPQSNTGGKSKSHLRSLYSCMRSLSAISFDFWATVCKTVRPMLSVCRLSCLSVLSVALVYCGQTVGWINMKLGMRVGLGPGHIVLNGNPARFPKGAEPPPNFQPISAVATWLDGSRCPGDFVLNGDANSLHKRGAEPPKTILGLCLLRPNG